jgi:outer membrane protein TolC
MKVLLLVLLTTVSLSATTLDQLVDAALADNPSLEAIEAKIAASQEAIGLADNFDDPMIGLAINAIHPDDITNRSIERMQSTAITISQRIPFFGKRDEKVAAAKAQKRQLDDQLEQAEALLAATVRSEAYALWSVQKLLQIESETAALMRHNADLFEGYSATASKAHMGIMAAELALSSSAMVQESLREAAAKRRARLSYLCGITVETLELDPKVTELPDIADMQQQLASNYALKASEAAIEQKKAQHAYEALQHYSDPTLQVGFFQREQFEDYVSLSLSFALPVYGSEDAKEQIAKQQLLEQEYDHSDLKRKVQSDFDTAVASLQSSYERYRILSDESLPKLEHMFELASASISTGDDLERYIGLIERKLMLEKQRIAAIAEFSAARATLNALTGVIR